MPAHIPGTNKKILFKRNQVNAINELAELLDLTFNATVRGLIGMALTRVKLTLKHDGLDSTNGIALIEEIHENL